jgi:hypothetical protein
VTVTVQPVVVSGTVTAAYPDGSAQPAAGVTVTLGTRQALTDAEGHYRLEFAASGETLVVDSPLYQPAAEATVYNGEGELDLTVTPWLVNVTVTSDSGTPLEGAEITAVLGGTDADTTNRSRRCGR